MCFSNRWVVLPWTRTLRVFTSTPMRFAKLLASLHLLAPTRNVRTVMYAYSTTRGMTMKLITKSGIDAYMICAHLCGPFFTGAREIRACVTQLERLDPEILPASCACASMYCIILYFVSVVCPSYKLLFILSHSLWINWKCHLHCTCISVVFCIATSCTRRCAYIRM